MISELLRLRAENAAQLAEIRRVHGLLQHVIDVLAEDAGVDTLNVALPGFTR